MRVRMGVRMCVGGWVGGCECTVVFVSLLESGYEPQQTCESRYTCGKRLPGRAHLFSEPVAPAWRTVGE